MLKKGKYFIAQFYSVSPGQLHWEGLQCPHHSSPLQLPLLPFAQVSVTWKFRLRHNITAKSCVFWVIFDLLHMILVPWKGSKVFTQLLQASAYHIFELDISTKIVFWNTRRLFLEAAAKEGRYKARALHYNRTLFIGQLPSWKTSRAGVPQ